MLRQTVSGQFEAKPGHVSVAGRAGLAAGFWGHRKKERMADLLLLVPTSVPRLAIGCSIHHCRAVDNEL